MLFRSDVDDTADPSGIDVVRLTVQRSPGSDDVDLSELSIQYVGDNGFANYIHTSENGDNEYAVQVITAASETDAVMTDDADRYQIAIPFNNSNGLTDVTNDGSNVNVSSDISTPLQTGSEAELEITTADRATRNAFIQVPDTIEDDTDSVTL